MGVRTVRAASYLGADGAVRTVRVGCGWGGCDGSPAGRRLIPGAASRRVARLSTGVGSWRHCRRSCGVSRGRAVTGVFRLYVRPVRGCGGGVTVAPRGFGVVAGPGGRRRG